ncbi:MAG TPA: carbon storage regulator [Myxococcales bacterium]|nr:carbon storage regulator [Myxococcales bacterium]HIN86641.1 carbon storage regulator [Myxococcales bacterium]
MLILTRRPGEAILIGEDIEILVKEVGRNHVRLGINAPKSVTIRRLETLEHKNVPQNSESGSKEKS